MSGKIALVTGASRGIGMAIAKRLARAEYALHLCAASGAGVRRMQQELAPASARQVDVGDPDALAEWAQELAGKGEVHALVHNAAPHRHGTLLETSDEDLDLMLRTQLVASSVLMSSLAPSMPRGAAAVLISSSLARRTNAGMTAVTVAKVGLVTLTRALAGSLLKRGIRVNGVAPATSRTDYLDAAAKSVGASMQELEADITKSQKLGLIEPDEVAELVYWLLSPASAKITGWTHYIDGGSLDVV
jgi:NAD(P)-dependent dehydrogenase (short-subunit alcohol dehydrogenase family)